MNLSSLSRSFLTLCLGIGLLSPPVLLAQEPGSLPEAELSPQSQSPQSPSSQTQSPPAQNPQAQSPPAQDPHAAGKRAAEARALGFLQYLDGGRYADSYAYTSRLIRSKMDRAQFAQDIEKDRRSLGAKVSRKLIDATYTTSLPGTPAGRYIVLRYATDFANKKGEVETITMSFERGYWRVAGWYRK